MFYCYSSLPLFYRYSILFYDCSDDLVPRGELEELQSRHRALQERLRDGTVSVQSFTDVVQRYDELECAMQRDYIEIEQYRLVEVKAGSAEERAAGLQEALEQKRRAHEEATLQLADGEERLDRCLAEMKVVWGIRPCTLYYICFVIAVLNRCFNYINCIASRCCIGPHRAPG